MTATLQTSSLLHRLEKRFRIEEEAQRTGKTFRRHSRRRVLLERYVVKPALHVGLRATGLYRRGVANALSPIVRRLQLSLPDLPDAFDGYTLLHLSDLHIDSVPGLPDALAGVLRTLSVDLCVMTGDYRFNIQGSCEPAFAGMRIVLDSIRSRHPILGILGNHDASEMAPRLQEMGVQILLNDAAAVHEGRSSFWVAGVDDPYDYRCDDLDAALSPTPTSAFRILLAHTPDLYAQAAAAGVSLYLCGHTHAGQVRLPLLGSVVENSAAPRAYTQGHWRHHAMHGYTSSGLGCSMMPIRFNCPPEIVLIELRKAAA